MSWFNLNFGRTILTWLAIIIVPLSTFLGCKMLPDGLHLDCSTSWIGPDWGGIIATALLILNQILKAFQGGTPGTGLVAPTVAVVDKKQEGTVTPAQVKSGH